MHSAEKKLMQMIKITWASQYTNLWKIIVLNQIPCIYTATPL